MSNDKILNKLKTLESFLEKKEKEAKIIYDSSITALLETGKSASRVSSIRSKDKLTLINEIKEILK